MSDTQRKTIFRFAGLFTLIALMFVCVIVKVIYVQVTMKDKCDGIIKTQVKTDVVISPIRGNILDCQGRLLATSLPEYTIHFDAGVAALHQKKGELFNTYIDSVSAGLSEIIGDKSASSYKVMMTQAFHSQKRKKQMVRLSEKSINYVQKKKIESLPLVKRGKYKSGIYFEERHRRSKPYGSLASRTIGSIYGEGGNGIAGLEKKFESYLHGQEGISTRQKVAGHWDYVPVVNAENGQDVVTTLDADLLDICEDALRARLARTQADWGCCILMEVKTGEIKAICNLDRDEKNNYVEKINHAVIRVEPGSTFKTISLMAVLDDGKKDLDDTIRVYRKGWMYNKLEHHDAHAKDTVYDLRSALAVSSNIAFAKMVTESYDKKASKFVDKLRKMGICDTFRCEIPGASSPRIDVPNDAVTLSKMAYGYSVELSPLQMVTFYNGIANDGKMVRPMLVKRIEKDGETEKEYDTEILKSSLCGKRTLKDVKLALHDVVWDDDLGTASVLKYNGRVLYYKAQSHQVHIAGKTGTAQLLVRGRYQSQQHRITFVGYFPEENPEYTCICMMEHPRNYPGYDAGWDCGTVVRVIAENTMAYAGVYEKEDGQMVWKKR